MEETAKQENATENEKLFTQDELNAIVSDRVKRANEKFADYDALKEKASKFDELEEQNKTELEKATEKASALQKELDELKAQNQLRELRSQVANETGVPAHLLTADTEEALKAQAQAIAEYAQPQGYPTVKDGGEVHQVGKHSTRDQFAQWAQQAFG